MIAFILAAGLGTRLKPLTDHCPKALVEYQGKPLLQHLLQRLQENGYRRFILNLHHFSDMLRDFAEKYAEENRIRIDFSDETAVLLDTGGALTHALPLFEEEEHILVHNVDVFSDVDLSGLEARFYGEKADALLSVRKRESKRFLFSDDAGRLCAWQNIQTGEYKGEKPGSADTAYAFSGIHIIKTALIKEWSLQYGTDRPFSVIDAYIRSACAGRRILLEPQTGGYWRDMGKISDFYRTTI